MVVNADAHYVLYCWKEEKKKYKMPETASVSTNASSNINNCHFYCQLSQYKEDVTI